jgi:hypothetical protein
MSNIVIEVMVVDVTQPEGKKFKNMEVTYKNKSFNDKTETKKINSYYGKAVFPILEDAKKGDIFTVTREKEGEFWQWTGITAGEAGKSSSPATQSTGSGMSSAARTYVADDVKQVMIIRQSSIASAVNLLNGQQYKASTLSDSAQRVIEIAMMFEAYVHGTNNTSLSKPAEPAKAALPADLNDDLGDLPI